MMADDKMQNLNFQKIKWLFTDIDGVWTDCTIFYSAKGEEMKAFSYRDGMGAERLRNLTDINIAIITGENSEIVSRRAEKLNITNVFLGIKNKLEVVEKFIVDNNLSWDNIAYIGDDLNDLEVMKKAAFTACPADAYKDIASIAHYKCEKKGGEGAFREFCELIINLHSA
jgi:3-deoxy-D-manno-octulosonate 8-phosphate phosphatase (KDO 8-P phosphatase)